jgi:cytochrome c biogenesis protein CcmG/thiol:disulfide interchange protein DsbE
LRRLAAILPVIALLALVAVFALFSLHRNPQVTPTAMVGKPLPAVSLTPLAGGAAVPLRAVVKGPILVNFYASWCAPCVEEAPALMALKAEGVRIVGVAYKDAPDKSGAFLARLGDPYEAVLMDLDGHAGVEFGATGVPETYAVNSAGVIVAKFAGPLDADTAEALIEKAGR